MRRLLAAVLATATLLAGSALVSPPAHARADYTSFFFDDPLLYRAGWASCLAPVTWSVDTRGLTASVARAEIRRMKRAWSMWSEASGIRVRFVGRQRLVFDPATNGLRRADGTPRPDRHVYMAFKTPRQVPIMTRGVIGLAMPTLVLLPTREIVGGMTIFRQGYVAKERKVRPRRVMHLYLHEIGHVLGLGHARKSSNVMFPSLDTMVTLGRGDRKGIASITQTCRR